MVAFPVIDYALKDISAICIFSVVVHFRISVLELNPDKDGAYLINANSNTNSNVVFIFIYAAILEVITERLNLLVMLKEEIMQVFSYVSVDDCMDFNFAMGVMGRNFHSAAHFICN